jgi:hypothetical protein
MNQTTQNSLFATDVVVSIENTTLGKVIVTCAIIFFGFFLIKKAFG